MTHTAPARMTADLEIIAIDPTAECGCTAAKACPAAERMLAASEDWKKDKHLHGRLLMAYARHRAVSSPMFARALAVMLNTSNGQAL